MTSNDSMITRNLWELANYTNGRPTKPSELVKQGIPVIKIAELSRGITSQTNLVSRHVVDSKHLVQTGDLLFAWSGTIGIHMYDGPEAALNQHIFKVVAKDFVDQNYLRYLLEDKLKVLQEFVEEKKTTMGHVTVANLKAIEVSIPKDLTKQRQIASYLESIDELLNLYKIKNKTLLDVAQTLFKSWFIDFDPVKAKLAGEKPEGIDDETAVLFPDSMEESELGLIPKGWKVLPSTDFFEVLSGGTPKTSNEDFWNGDIPWFSVIDAPDSGGCFFTNTTKTITQKGLDNSAAKLVRPGVTVISARGTVGKTAIVAIPSTFNQSCYGIEGKHGDFFTYLLIRNQVIRLQRISHGGMFDTITRETFSAIKVAKPKLELIGIFETLVTPIFMEIRNLQFQSDCLVSIRDSLLPRLISGELKIPEEMFAS
jgi:type I restriction enzyme S subunit